MATHPSILAWRIPWTEEPGGLQSMGSQRVRHDLTTKQQGPQRETNDWKGAVCPWGVRDIFFFPPYPPQTKGLKKQTKKPNPHGEEWRGSYCLGGSWNLLQSMNCSPKERRWLAGRALFSVFPTSVYIFGFKFAWILTFFNV